MPGPKAESQTPEWLKPYLDYGENQPILDRIMTDEGLIPTVELTVTSKPSGEYHLYLKAMPEVEVFPTPSIRRVANYLVARPSLWSVSSIEVEVAPSIVGRIAIFGVSFRQAVESVIRGGHIKSKFQLLDPDRVQQNGVVATLITFVSYNKVEKITDVQVLQGIADDSETFLIHALISVEREQFVHLDGSTIHLDPVERQRLFDHAQKVKGPKRKHFRLDGEIPLTEGFDISTAYLPVEELSVEYFEVTLDNRVKVC